MDTPKIPNDTNPAAPNDVGKLGSVSKGDPNAAPGKSLQNVGGKR